MSHPPLPPQVQPPGFALSPVSPSRVVGAAIVALAVLPGDDGPLLGPGADELVADTGLDLLEAVALAGATGAAGEVVSVPVVGKAATHSDALLLVLLVGVGDATPAALRRAGAALVRHTHDQDAVASAVAAVGGDDVLAAFVAGAVLGSFGYHQRSAGPRTTPVGRVVLACTSDDEATQAALDRALAIAGAGWQSRALATVPANVKTPGWLAEQAVTVAEAAGLRAKVWDQAALGKDGFGGILAVGRGSASPPYLVRLDYVPPGRRFAKSPPRVVLVGKGITFDTGGLSIKPAALMVNMKRDMSGAAAVLATMGALADVGCPVQVTGLLAIAENSVGGDAMRPGDVITQYAGRTTEVNNTDAEGRLVMADALAYAVDQLDPALLVDVATLTGGIKVALGLQTGGLFSTDHALAAALLAAGAAAGEPLWRMPLEEIYEPNSRSPIADSINAPAPAQAVAAALFLRHFTGGRPWAHLDLASVGDVLEERDEWTVGPSGFGPRLLLHWLGSPDPLVGIGS